MGHLCHVPLGETPTLALTLKAYFESVFIAREPCSEKALSQINDWGGEWRRIICAQI